MNFTRPLIKIKAKDSSKYAQIAYLVDRQDFIADVFFIRKKLNIVPTLHQLIEKEEIKIRKAIIRQSVAASVFRVNTRSNVKEKSVDEYFHEFTNLLSRYHRPTYFYNVVKFAILSGEVWEKDLRDTVMPSGGTLHGYNMWPSDSAVSMTLNPWEVAIVIYPETKQTEVIELFKMIQETRGSNPSWKPFDTKVNNIKRNRRWYWLNKQGVGYQTLAKMEEKKKIFIGWGGIRDSIKIYETNVSVPLNVPL